MFRLLRGKLSVLSDLVSSHLPNLVIETPVWGEQPIADLSDDEDDMPREAPRPAREGLSSWAEREAVLKGRLKRKKEKVLSMEEELKGVRDEVSKLTASLTSLQDERNVLLKERESYRQENKGLAEKIAKAHGQIRRQNEELTGYAGTRAQLAEVTRELDACRRQIQAGATLLEVRTTELRDAQQYLGKPDSMSYAEVKRLVENLNEEIFQTAALVTDEFAFGQTRPCTEEFQTAYTNVSHAIGSTLTQAIVRHSHNEDSILVQVLVQAYLAQRTHWVINCWSPNLNYVGESLLATIFRRISATEPQAVSARWRALTKRHVDSSTYKDEDYITALHSHLAGCLIETLILSGAQLSSEEIAEKIEKMFGAKLASISRQSMGLHRIIGEEMSTSDFVVLCPRCDDQFEPELMEDPEADGPGRGVDLSSRSRSPIMCTTDIGLRRYSKKANSKGEEGVLEESVLLKAKVVMPSMLDSEALMGRPEGLGTAMHGA